MRPNETTLSIERSQFLGLLSAAPSTHLPGEFSPRLSNVLIRDGVVMKRPGYHQFVDQNLAFSTTVDPPPEPPDPPSGACVDLPTTGDPLTDQTLSAGATSYTGKAITSAAGSAISGGNATAVTTLTVDDCILEGFNYAIYLGDADQLDLTQSYLHTNHGGDDYVIRGAIGIPNISCSTLDNRNGNKACIRVYGFTGGTWENSVFLGGRMMLGGGGANELTSQIDSHDLDIVDCRVACETVEIYSETHHILFDGVDFSGTGHITCHDSSHHLEFRDCTRDGHPLNFHDDFHNGDALALVAAGRNITITTTTARLADSVTDGTLTGEILALVDFQLLNETRYLVALTAKRQYRYDEGLEGWVDITTLSTAYNITGASTGADTFTIAGNHAAEFAAGVPFRVKGSTGNDFDYVSLGAVFGTDTVITVASVADATADGTLAKVLELTTIEGDVIDWVVGTDDTTHRLYFTNGRDRPRFWDGVTDEFEIWSPTFTDFVTCKTMRVFYDHLVLGNITYVTGEPKTVAWSDTTEFDDFETGEAGVALIPGISGSIQRLENLGDRLICYSDDSIASIMFVGYPIVFAFEVVIPTGVRLISPRAIVHMGPAHLYCSQENIYLFDGTKSVRAVSDRIQRIYKNNIDFEFGDRFFGFNDVAKRTIYFVAPSSETTAVIFVLDYDVFDLNRFKWTLSDYTDRPSCMGFFLQRFNATWVSPPDVAWEEDYGIWDDEGEKVNFPVRLMGSGTRVFAMDETSGLDDDETVTGSYETADFVLPQNAISMFGRWIELEADLAGTEVTVSYSLDQGRNWTVCEVTTLQEDFGHYRYPIDGNSRTLRIKFESDLYFALRWLKAWVIPGAAR